MGIIVVLKSSFVNRKSVWAWYAARTSMFAERGECNRKRVGYGGRWLVSIACYMAAAYSPSDYILCGVAQMTDTQMSRFMLRSPQLMFGLSGV